MRMNWMKIENILPQTRHKPKRAENHIGGFLRVSEDPHLVA